MKLIDRAVNIFRAIKNNKKISLRKISEKTSIPKSSVHRHKVNQQKRIDCVGHDFFETEIGVEWLNRLLLATILIFGIQSGVGSEIISLFLNIILISLYVSTSPSSIRNIKQSMRQKIEIYGKINFDEILERCKNKELHLGGDETTFGTSLFLILMELASGFIFKEELTEDRKYKTWNKCVGYLLTGFNKILSFSSDGGKALLKMGKKAGCNNVMDLFHLLQDVKRLFATKFHSKRRSLFSKLKKLSENNNSSDNHLKQEIKIINKQLEQLDKGQKIYRDALFSISTETHPFKNMSETQTSSELEEKLTGQLIRLKEVAKECNIEDKNNLLSRYESRIKPQSQLNDLWLQWVEQSIACKTNNPEIKIWAKHILLPLIYWKEQLRKSKRKEKLKRYYQNKVNEAQTQLDAHKLTPEHLNYNWLDWAKAMTVKYQRTTSAIEGRNARLAHHYFSSRGIRKAHICVLTILHNFWIKRDDDTTAAERLCDFKPPNLFEYLLKNMDNLPLLRIRNKKIISSTLN